MCAMWSTYQKPLVVWLSLVSCRTAGGCQGLQFQQKRKRVISGEEEKEILVKKSYKTVVVDDEMRNTIRILEQSCFGLEEEDKHGDPKRRKLPSMTKGRKYRVRRLLEDLRLVTHLRSTHCVHFLQCNVYAFFDSRKLWNISPTEFRSSSRWWTLYRDWLRVILDYIVHFTHKCIKCPDRLNELLVSK